MFRDAETSPASFVLNETMDQKFFPYESYRQPRISEVRSKEYWKCCRVAFNADRALFEAGMFYSCYETAFHSSSESIIIKKVETRQHRHEKAIRIKKMLVNRMGKRKNTWLTSVFRVPQRSQRGMKKKRQEHQCNQCGYVNNFPSAPESENGRVQWKGKMPSGWATEKGPFSGFLNRRNWIQKLRPKTKASLLMALHQ